MLGAIEAGGTKFVCADGNDKGDVIDKINIRTTTPEQTLTNVFEFFDKHNLSFIGIGSFGPIDINKNSKKYGFITTTPKKGWNNFNFLGVMKERYSVPIAWTTDVNAATYGEYKKGNGKVRTSVLVSESGVGQLLISGY